MTSHYTDPSYGFTLLEFLVVSIIMALITAWAVPQYQRQLALNHLDQYTKKIESGLFSLRARQSAEGTSCEMNFDANYVGVDKTDSGFGSTANTMELSHLSNKERDQRLQCCDTTNCEWNPPYRLINLEQTGIAKNVEIKVSKAAYSMSPPGTSTDGNDLVVLVRSTYWNRDPARPLPIRCVKLSASGHLHSGTWEKMRCRRR